MRRFVLLILFTLIYSVNAFSQCAMCRSTLENNISNGNVGIAAGINTGILYLLSLPYLAVMVLGYLWYRNSKRNATKLDSSPA
ncbi:MAG: hypothetical protein L6Q51_08800 [Cyclobacteriaceae bacterium]|nr:hypothetical protein [Cyclobacteriaceae bacterium]